MSGARRDVAAGLSGSSTDRATPGTSTLPWPTRSLHRALASAALACSLLTSACGRGPRTFESPVRLGGREIAADTLNRGEFIYMSRCRGCHGARGRGDGPYAASLSRRPHDLTSGTYPRSGAARPGLPTDAALVRVISEGIEGSPMTAQGLSDEDTRAVVHYLKTLAPAWSEPAR